MARSSYIYFVRVNGGELLGAFTVKHEAETWAKDSDHNIADLQLSRAHDGVYRDKRETKMAWSSQIENCTPPGALIPTDALTRLRAYEILKAFYAVADLGDYVYDIREREALGWEGPKVLAWADADKQAKELFDGEAKRLEAARRESATSETLVEENDSQEESA